LDEGEKMKEKYEKIKIYTPVAGFFIYLFYTIMLMIPFLNIYLSKLIYDLAQKPINKGKGFYEDAWYYYAYKKVKK
jgi:hypothetical protein